MLIKASTSIRFKIIHEMTSRDNNLLNIAWLCEIAGVSRSGYYEWKAREGNRLRREEQDKRDFEIIAEAYAYRGFAKGVDGIYGRLLHIGTAINKKKIRRLLRKFGLFCPIRKANPYRRMQKAVKEASIAPNLLKRQFRERGKRAVLLTDITYIKRADGFSYLSVIMDAYTKQALSYAVSESLEQDFVLDCVTELKEKFGGELCAETLIHSDQGAHYGSHKFAELTADAGLRRSMSCRANCWDNAPQESFFGHMKDEVCVLETDTHKTVCEKVADWLDYYNRDRTQRTLYDLTPNEFYEYVKTGVNPLASKKGKDKRAGALPPNPQGLTLYVSKENGAKKENDNKAVLPANPDTRSGRASALPYPRTGQSN
jgi:transposase InsO family protein